MPLPPSLGVPQAHGPSTGQTIANTRTTNGTRNATINPAVISSPPVHQQGSTPVVAGLVPLLRSTKRQRCLASR